MPLRTSDHTESAFRHSERRQGDRRVSSSPFRRSEPDSEAFRSSERQLPERDADAYRASAELFDAACRRAQLDRKEIAHLLGISQSLVDKWASPNERACPSHPQMLRLPLSFHLALWWAMNRRYGIARALVGELFSAFAGMAIASER